MHILQYTVIYNVDFVLSEQSQFSGIIVNASYTVNALVQYLVFHRSIDSVLLILKTNKRLHNKLRDVQKDGNILHNL